jgi:hypothetical protein
MEGDDDLAVRVFTSLADLVKRRTTFKLIEKVRNDITHIQVVAVSEANKMERKVTRSERD